MVLVLLLVALPLFLVIYFQKYKVNGGILHLPPGPPGLPLIGNLLQMGNSAPYVCLWQLSKQYGPIMSLRLGCRPVLVVSSARMAKEALKVHDHEFSSRPSLFSLEKISYNFLNLSMAPYGEYWREMRKICVVHLYSSKRALCFRSIREYEVSRMIEKISKSASATKLTNLSEMMMLLTSSIISRIAFGKRYEDEEGCERSRFHGLLNEIQAMIGSFFFTDYVPFIGWWIDKLTGMIGRLEKSFQELDLFYHQIINEHIDPKRPEKEQEDVIDVLIRIKRERLFSIDLTWDHIKAVLLEIFVAGTDTGAAALVWAMAEVMKNPQVIKKAQDELRNAFGKKGFIDEDDLHKLPYLKALVKETLRLHPPVPLLVPRETLEKCTIDGYEIPSKTLVYVNAWAIGRDPEAWENPEEFLPERFLNSSVDFKGQDYQLIPFGTGRRICPGIHLGVVTVELALANLLYSFDWEMPHGMNKDDIDMDVKPGVTVHKRNDLYLQARQYIT